MRHFLDIFSNFVAILTKSDMNYENYSYFKGEKKNPHEHNGDVGKSFWWTLESYAAGHGDQKKKKELSVTMIGYIREKMWEGDGYSDLSLEVALIRATEMYKLGIWDRSYLNCSWVKLDDAIKLNMEDNKLNQQIRENR